MTKITTILKLSLCILIVFLYSCKPKLKTEKSIYYCMERLILDSSQMKVISETGVKKLYVKFFDVFWNPILKAPNATAKMLIDKKTKDWLKTNGVEVVPVVFIDNDCLEKIYVGKYNALAERIYGLLNGQLTNYTMLPDIHEIQFNCDWTDSSRETYFSLINYLKILPMILDRKLTLSAAVYYDQCKQPDRLGIPPVNRVMLMCFNSPEQDVARNTVRTFKNDIAGLSNYPLPMDVAFALPGDKFVYRKDKLSSILQNIQNVKKPDSSIAGQGYNEYPVIKDTLLNGSVLKKDDRIYMPPGNIQEILSTEKLLSPRLFSGNATISILWTDSSAARKYDSSQLNAMFGEFNK